MFYIDIRRFPILRRLSVLYVMSIMLKKKCNLFGGRAEMVCYLCAFNCNSNTIHKEINHNVLTVVFFFCKGYIEDTRGE